MTTTTTEPLTTTTEGATTPGGGATCCYPETWPGPEQTWDGDGGAETLRGGLHKNR